MKPGSRDKKLPVLISGEELSELQRHSLPKATTTRDLTDLVKKGILIKTGKLKSTRYELNLVPANSGFNIGNYNDVSNNKTN